MIVDRLIEKIHELTPISKNSIDLLLSCAQQEKLSKRQCVLVEGQICNYLFFVEYGFLRTYLNQDGKEINTNFTFEGNFTSNLKSLKKQEPSQFNIEAGEKSLVTLLNKDKLLEMYSRSSEIELLCRRILGLFLIEIIEYSNFSKLLSPKERYNYLIKNNPQMIQRIPVSQLSSYIGVARETLSRIRKSKK